MSKEITFKAIVSDGDNWQRYQARYAGQVSSHQVAEVEKMLRCGDPAYGYATYICLACGETKRVGFSCKSRVCSSCGKVHADEWSQRLVGRLFNVTHRHITFTVADKLWPLLEANPEWRKALFAAANQALRRAIRGRPGIVMVLHPYGKDLKVNYHLHVLVTEGGLNERGEWQEQTYINYKTLRKVWQYEVLSRIRQKLRATGQKTRLIDRLFKKYKNGFYVHAEPRVTSGWGISRYIGRYIRHPAIADSRIIRYDGETVTFYYEVRREGKKIRHEVKLPVLAFIHGVVRHIPPQQFKLVRYYGLYARRSGPEAERVMAQIGAMRPGKVRRLSWRGRIGREFGRDPLQCPHCGAADMELFSLTVLNGGRLKTMGGWEWLLANGAVRETGPPGSNGLEKSETCAQGGQVVQLSFDFEAAARNEAARRWVQPALL